MGGIVIGIAALGVVAFRKHKKQRKEKKSEKRAKQIYNQSMDSAETLTHEISADSAKAGGLRGTTQPL